MSTETYKRVDTIMVPPPPLSAGDGDTVMDEGDVARLAQEKSDEEVARELQRSMEAEEAGSAGATSAEAAEAEAEARRRALESDAEVARKLQDAEDEDSGLARGGSGGGGGGAGADAGGAWRAPAERVGPCSSDALGGMASADEGEVPLPPRKEPRVGSVTSRAAAADGMGAAAHSTKPDAAAARARKLDAHLASHQNRDQRHCAQ
jgi:hypothetical protein